MDPQSGRSQIWSVSYPGGEVSRFTNDLANYELCCLDISSDGNALVALQTSVFSDVWVSGADGSQPRQVSTGEALGLGGVSWLGDKILTGNLQGQWFTMNADGSNRSPATAERTPYIQVSTCADAQHIIYTTFQKGGLELWAVRPDGSNAVQLAPRGAIGAGTCSPDSKSVVYGTNEGIWRVPIEGGKSEKTTLPLTEIGFSRDGKMVFYAEQKIESSGMVAKVVVIPAAGGARLYEFPAPFGMQSPKFTPDGKSIAYLLTRNNAANVWMQPLAGGNPVQLTRFTNGEIYAFSWSGNGRELAFSRGTHKTDVVMMKNFRNSQ